MKYVDIDKETARQCCKEHTVFNDKKHKERMCDNCPLRRTFYAADGTLRQGICWFILMKGLESDQSPYAQVERRILEQQDVSYPKEWSEWVKEHAKEK